MIEIKNVDELMQENEYIFLEVLDNKRVSVESGVFKITDALRGNRNAVQANSIIAHFKHDVIFLSEKLGSLYNIYKIDQKNDPEYFL